MSARLAALALAAVLVTAGCSGTPDDEVAAVQSPSERGETGPTLPPPGPASVRFAAPVDGDTVASPVMLEFEADNVIVEPAASGVHEGAGHFHVIVDSDCVAPGATIPNDDQHLHFGDGSTSGELELAPGPHTLCLQLADGVHTALDLTDEISITVEG